MHKREQFFDCPLILSAYIPCALDLQVTKRVNDGGGTYGGWQSWNWKSAGDVFLNGAYFVNSGAQEQTASVYAQAISVAPLSGQRTPAITAAAGPLN
jgi:pectate lyase